MKRRGLLAAFVVVGLLAAPVLASDWPGYRGLFRDGISLDTNLPVKWTNENFLWKMKLPGPGAASPIVYGDKVFLCCYTGYGQKLTKGGKVVFERDGGKAKLDEQKLLRRHLLCVDAKTGQELWQQTAEPVLPEQHWDMMLREHGYSSSTPVTDGERVYVFYGKTGVLAYDFTGKLLWQTSVGTDSYLYGSAASPVLHKNLLFVNASPESKSLIALDTSTGKEVWRKRNIWTWASPIVVQTKEGEHELVMNEEKHVAAYEPATGKELWRCQGLPVPQGSNTFCTPVCRDGIIYLDGGATPGTAGPQAMAIRSGGRGDVSKSHVLWRTKAGGSLNSPIVHGDYVYVVEHFVTCLLAEDGKQVYKQRLYDGNYPYASPVLIGDKIYMQHRFEGLYVFSTGSKFEVLAHNTFPDDDSNFNASPAISNGRMYIRSDKYLYCIGNKK